MKYHFIGIKGSGMSSLAQIMFDLGYEVQGSDKEEHFFTQIALDERGIKLTPYDASNITNDLIVVVGASIKADNPELVKALELGLTKYDYYELLGSLTKKYNTIAICGCHGKTTTTALMSHVFNNIIGTNFLIGDGTGHANKENKHLIIEACEYYRHFLSYYPSTTIITNIELDHVDYFKDLDDIKNAYIEFANQTGKQIIACGDDDNIRDIKDKIKKKAIYLYGFREDNDFKAVNVVSTSDGSTFDTYYKDKFLGNIKINAYGKHMILNTLAVIAAAYLENLDMNDVKKYLMTYGGAKRRFAQTQVKDMIIIDDYAHHPTEIKAVIEAARQKYPTKEIVGVFLPHTYSRTKALYKDVVNVLNTIDKSYILDIYPAREKEADYPGISSSLIIDLLNNGASIKRDDVSPLLNHQNSVIIFMSPDDLTDMIKKVVQLMEK